MTSEITAARPGGFLLFACIALAALLLSGCGGGSATLPMDDTADQELTAPVGGGQSDTTSPTESGNPGQSGGAPPAEDSTPAVKFGTMLPLGSPLPDVPKDEVKASAKAASTILNYPGADFMLAAGGTVDGDELVLESSEDSIAWAMYRAEGLGDLDIEIYSIEALPGDLGQNYEVAFSEFVSDDWLFLINSTLPEAEVNLAEADGQFISALGNLYFLVTVDGGDSVRISVSHLLTADENPNDPPDDPPVPFTFIGPLLEMGDSFFSISNEQGLATTFSFDDATQWFGLNGEQISPADLVPGDVLLVEALETGAGWYALGVMLVERGGGGDPGDPGKMVFLEGEILTIGNGQLVLISPDSGPTGGEKVVNYNEETQWFTENGEAGPGDFAPGDFVLVDALLTDSGLLAVAVFGFRTGDPGDPGDPRTYVGELTAIDESTLTLEQEIV
ncbi:MAG TPA: hypothetical protein ENO21_01540, partial [Firmicutes bacterium]|nr:hypothetical protein [Bacillota bacterium]